MTPLLDFFRRGDVARDIRLLAARGALAPRAHEQLGLLVLLVADPDPEIAAAAEATLAILPPEGLAAFLARPEVTAEVRTFFAGRGITPAAGAGAEIDAPLVDTAPPVGSKTEPEDELSTVQRIAAMNVAQRISVALKGTREERTILIRDPNKIVAVAVLSSPKMTETEIEGIARMGSVSDEILRMIANNRAWTKNYQVVVALTKNAKTPLAVSMNLLSRLNEKDLRMLSSDRNVPDTLRLTARKKIVLDK
jgi:hypothetical protein